MKPPKMRRSTGPLARSKSILTRALCRHARSPGTSSQAFFVQSASLRWAADRHHALERATQNAGPPNGVPAFCLAVLGWQRLGGDLARLAHGAEAAGADVQPNAHTIDHDPLVLHIRAEVPVGAPLREAHVFTECLGLATHVTFTGHGGSPLSCSPPRDRLIRRATVSALARHHRGVKAAPSPDDADPMANATTALIVSTARRLPRKLQSAIGQDADPRLINPEYPLADSDWLLDADDSTRTRSFALSFWPTVTFSRSVNAGRNAHDKSRPIDAGRTRDHRR